MTPAYSGRRIPGREVNLELHAAERDLTRCPGQVHKGEHDEESGTEEGALAVVHERARDARRQDGFQQKGMAKILR